MADAKPPAKPSSKPADKPSLKKILNPPPIDKLGNFEIIVLVLIALVLFPILASFLFSNGNNSAISVFASSAFSILKNISTVVSMIALVIAVYAFVRIQEISREATKKLGLALNWSTERNQKNARWEKVEQYMTSLNSSDWKIAVLEADNMLDDIVERMGYKGPTLGERMKNIKASDFPYLDETWQAHKLRNSIAHKGTDYPLTRTEAEQAINTYHRVFKQLGYLD